MLQKLFLTRVKLILLVVVVIGLSGFAVFIFRSWLPIDAYVVEDYTSSPVMASESGEWISELPVRLIIPAIAVDAHVQHVGVVADGSGNMDIPSNFSDVGWYEPGTRPGMIGSAVIAGHYNGKNVPRAVFYDLDKLQIGDEIIIKSAKRIEDIFQVVRIEAYDYDAVTTEIFLSHDGQRRLNLITCGGIWLPDVGMYDRRVVIFATSVMDTD